MPILNPRRDKIKSCCLHFDAVEYEQHFLFDCPLYTGIRQQHTVMFGAEHGSIRVCLERNADQIPLVAHYIHLCFQARITSGSPTRTVNPIY